MDPALRLNRGVIYRRLIHPNTTNQECLPKAVRQTSHLICLAEQMPSAIHVARECAAIANSLAISPIAISPASSPLSEFNSDLWFSDRCHGCRVGYLQRTEKSKRCQHQNQCA